MAEVLIRSSDTQEQYAIDDSNLDTPNLYYVSAGQLGSYSDGSFTIVCYYPSNLSYP